MEQGDAAMIRPEDFYSADDKPSKSTVGRVWHNIRRHASPLQSTSWFITDVRSFAWGMAATVVLGLALVGAWTLTRQAFENSEPQPLRLEKAYVSAISEFEHVLPLVTAKSSLAPQGRDEISQRTQQLNLLDAAITQLRRQTNGSDLSPLLRERLRQLYAMKLQILQQMIEKGEIEL
jgi:hypothetical protein